MVFSLGINNAVVTTGNNDYKPFIGSVAVSDGRIAYVGEKKITNEDAAKVLDGYGKVLMPGLVNSHCHGDMTLARGLGDGLTLQEQNNAFASHNWFSDYITEEDRFYSRQLTYCEALLNGTTFILENMFWDLGRKSVKAIKETGIKGGLALDIRKNFAVPDIFLNEGNIKAFINECEYYGYIPVIGSISEEDFSPDRLSNIKRYLEIFKIKSTCHLAETVWRVTSVKQKHNVSPIQLLEKYGAFDKNVLGSHVVHLDNSDIKLLADNNVKVVNTPVAEMKIADGIAPIRRMLDAGIKVSLGSDGALWNNSNDIFREIVGMNLLHTINSGIRTISKKELLDMATINGAAAFGLEEEIGTIEVGKLADFILIDILQVHLSPINIGKNENVSSVLTSQVNGRDTTDVFINGEHIVENKEIQTIDVRRIMEHVNESHQKIVSKL